MDVEWTSKIEVSPKGLYEPLQRLEPEKDATPEEGVDPDHALESEEAAVPEEVLHKSMSKTKDIANTVMWRCFPEVRIVGAILLLIGVGSDTKS